MTVNKRFERKMNEWMNAEFTDNSSTIYTNQNTHVQNQNKQYTDK